MPRSCPRLLLALAAAGVLSACGDEAPQAVPPAGSPPSERALPSAAELSHPDVVRRRAAAQALEGAPPGAATRVEALAGVLTRDADRWVREAAGRALRDLGPEAAPAVPALILALRDEDDYVRWRAAEALGRMGASGAPGLSELERHARDADETEVVRASSEAAVVRIRAALAAAAPAPAGR